MHMWFKTFLIGLLSGYLSGQFGIGGAALSTPLLRIWLDVPPYLALGTTLPPILPGAIAGVLTYNRFSFVDKKILPQMILGGLARVLAGSLVTPFIPPHFLMFLTGILLLLISFRFFIPKKKKGGEKKGRSIFIGFLEGMISEVSVFEVGAGAGFLSGLLGIGGGFILIPGMVYFLGMEIKKDFGTSLAVIPFLVLPASFIHYFLGHISLKLAFWLTLGTVLGAMLGAKVAVRTSSQILRYLFGSFLFLFSFYFAYLEGTLLWSLK